MEAVLSRSVPERDFFWLLAGVARVHGIPFNAALTQQAHPPPYTLAAVQAACASLGLSARIATFRPAALRREELPVAICLKPAGLTAVASAGVAEGADEGAGRETDRDAEPVLGLVVRTDGERLVYFAAGSEQATIVGVEECDERFESWSLVVSPKVAPAPQDEADRQPRRFGFRWFLPELLKYRGVWRDVLLASLAIQVLGLSAPLFTQVIIDKVIVHHTLNTLMVVAAGLLMFMLFSAVMTWVRQYLVLHTGNRIDAVLGSRVFAHLVELPVRYFEHRSTGTLVARLQGVEAIREFISGAAVTLFLDIPFLLVFIAVMFFYSWQLTCVVLAVLLLITLLSLGITPVLRQRLNAQFQLGARNQAFITEYVSGMETVKALQMEPQLRRRWGDLLSGYLGAGFKTRRLANTYNVSANTLEQLQVTAILCLGAWFVMQSPEFTVGMLVAFQMFASRLSQPVLRMVGLWQEFQQASIAVKRLGDIMDAPTEPYATVPEGSPDGRAELRIDGLAFRYAQNLPYLFRNMRLDIPRGHCVAIMGPSGSGKSTLGKLLLGFRQPVDGRILIDGRDSRHLPANELRRFFGVVPQETALFSGTLYENLVMGNPSVGFEEVVEACRLAEVHEVIENLPNGYQTRVGERGAGLSGGQKQRVAIARALLKRPKILLFDEATSSLDEATAEQLGTTISRLRGKVTILFITHRVPKTLVTDVVVHLGRESAPRAPATARSPEDLPLSDGTSSLTDRTSTQP